MAGALHNLGCAGLRQAAGQANERPVRSRRKQAWVRPEDRGHATRASVVTGAHRGIGVEFARQLEARGAGVVAVCRRRSPELDALDDVEPENVRAPFELNAIAASPICSDSLVLSTTSVRRRARTSLMLRAASRRL